MPNETLSRRYATAVFQLAQEAGKVEGVQHDLHTFVEALGADEDVRKFFRSPVVDRKEKAEIVAQFDVLERDARGAQELRVTSARPLARAELDAIVQRLAAAYRTKFDVTQSVDPNLIAGVRITIGDRLIDGTIAGRLDDIARLLSTN